MNAEQALQYLMQVLVSKQGLSMQELAATVQAWNIVAETISKKEQPVETKGDG